MKIKLLFVLMLFVLKVFSQDSIVNFLNAKGKIVTKNKAVEIETLVKKDTLWQLMQYYKNGRLKKIGHYKTNKKEVPVGEFLGYNRKGKNSKRLIYDLNGKKHGNYISWFDNGNINTTGKYLDNIKEGIWKYYHYNGKEACRLYFRKDSILKTILYNEEGQVLTDNKIEYRKPKFKGGNASFKTNVRKLVNYIDYNVKGKIHINFAIDIDGKIRDVEIEEEVPKRFHKQIISFFENMKGWQPGMHNNRRHPASYRFPLTFGTE